MRKYFFLAIIWCLVSSITAAQAPQLELEFFAFGLNRPVDIAYPPGDPRLWVVEQTGKIRIVDPMANTILPEAFLDLTGIAVQPDGNEQGLLGLAFHPNYAQNGWFFVNYTRADRSTVIQRFSRSATNPAVADPNSGAEVLVIAQPFANHNGGCLRFGPDGMLYIATGDGGFSDLPADPFNNAQNPAVLLGKMLRINVDQLPYSIPPDNPFVGQGNFAPEIWAMGLRNPWRFHFDRLTGDCWIGDVGMSKFDEINLHRAGTPAGQNFGWKCYEGTVGYQPSYCIDTVIVTEPVFEYANVGGFCGASAVGGTVYRGQQYPGMAGWYVFCDFCTQQFYGLKPNPTGGFDHAALGKFDLTYNYSAIGAGSDGELYVTGYIAQGLYRIKDRCLQNPAPLPQVALLNDSLLVCTNDTTGGLQLQWLLDGQPIAPANTVEWAAGQSGIYALLLTAANGCQAISAPLEVIFTETDEVKKAAMGFSISPNPAKNELFLNLKNYPQGTLFLQINDQMGREMAQFSFQNNGSTARAIYLDGWKNGWYVAKLQNAAGWSQTVKFQVIK